MQGNSLDRTVKIRLHNAQSAEVRDGDDTVSYGDNNGDNKCDDSDDMGTPTIVGNSHGIGTGLSFKNYQVISYW